MTTIDELKRAAQRQPPLRAPYNFVPLNSKVLETPWEGEPDLTRPHPQGICGQLLVEWRCETPLLVGGLDNNTPFQLDAGGPYAIPGASLRGMIRAILEILSYADLGFYDNQRFSIRDYDGITWQDIQKRQSGERFITPPLAGWLSKIEGQYQLTACEQVDVPIADIAAKLGMAKDGWDCLSLHARHATLKAAHFDGVIDDLGDISPSLHGKRGTLVLAGLIKSEVDRRNTKRGKVTNKAKEVAFLDPPSGQTWTISQAAFEAFAAVQVKDGNRHGGAPEENWSFWAKKLEAGEAVPVFYRGDPGQAAHQVPVPDQFVMALTRLMRIPHRFTTADVARETQTPLSATKLDFVQAMFGHVPQTDAKANATGRQRAWRSRVRFGLATLVADQQVRLLDARPAVTMRPRASFYPFYLRPDAEAANVTHPVDWSNPAARLAGRKRYPPRDEVRSDLPCSSKKNPEQENELRFLDASRERPLIFRSPIRFHNLLPEELGGLIWAIGLGNPGRPNERRLRHMLGRAKGFGYGQVQATILTDDSQGWIEANSATDPPTFANCADKFEKWVTTGLDSDQPFAEQPEVAACLALCDADLGAELREALRFPCSPETGSPQDEAERILEAYSKIKKHSACGPNRTDQRRQGGERVSDDPEDEAFLFLPPYPFRQR